MSRCASPQRPLETVPWLSLARHPGRPLADFCSPEGGDVTVDAMSFELYLTLTVGILFGFSVGDAEHPLLPLKGKK